MKALGTHVILDLHGCPSESLDDIDFVSRELLRAVAESGAALIQPVFHKFAPQGVSGVAIIAESHFSIHTWPEHGYAAIDVFTCGESINIARAAAVLRAAFRPAWVRMNSLPRGVLDTDATEIGLTGLEDAAAVHERRIPGSPLRERRRIDAGCEGGKAP
jgi:S-adenosylmethionine decarboxylase